MPNRRIEGINLSNALGIKTPDRQLCYSITTPQHVDQGHAPDLKIDNVSEFIEWGEGGDYVGTSFSELDRYAFVMPNTPTLTLHGTLNDRRYVTFAVASSGQTSAGPLKVRFATSKPGWVDVQFSGDWQYEPELAAILTNGHQAYRQRGFTQTGTLGGVVSASFHCEIKNLKEVHFRMCGLQRFVAYGIATSAGMPGSPRIAEEHLSPTLAGKPPIWTGALPQEESDPSRAPAEHPAE